MGGGSSKRVKDYVLHVEGAMELDGAAVSSASPKPDKSLVRRASVKGGAINLPLPNDLVSPNSNEAKSNTEKLKDAVTSAAGNSPNGKVTRRHSLSSLGKMVIASNAFSAPVSKRCMKTSERCPWILKQAVIGPTNTTNESVDIGRVIGTGLMGTVRIVKFKNNNTHFALKSIKKDYINRHKDYRHIDNELRLLYLLRSHFCIKLFGTFQDSNNIYFALELAAGGELFRRLSKKESFKPPVAKFYATEIFSALEHVQSLGYVYRDLKPENVMLDEDGHCKLVDFGFAVQPDNAGMIHTVCGTPAYLSPEQLNGKFTNGYQKIVDWWSFGVFLFELLTGKTPFCRSNKETPYEIYLRILKVKISFPSFFDQQSKDLISSLCHADLNKRLVDPEKIKVHGYFEVPWEHVSNRKLVPPFVPRLNVEVDDHYFGSYHNEALDTTESKWDFDGF